MKAGARMRAIPFWQIWKTDDGPLQRRNQGGGTWRSLYRTYDGKYWTGLTKFINCIQCGQLFFHVNRANPVGKDGKFCLETNNDSERAIWHGNGIYILCNYDTGHYQQGKAPGLCPAGLGLLDRTDLRIRLCGMCSRKPRPQELGVKAPDKSDESARRLVTA